MSPPDEYALQLSELARTDFRDILIYTRQQWGQQQMMAYGEILDKALKSITQNPHLGHRREDLSDEHRAVQTGQHVIVYRIIEYVVYVSRILHGSMDFYSQDMD